VSPQAEKVVDIPGVGTVAFPGSMSDEAIGLAIKNNVLKQARPGSSQSSSVSGSWEAPPTFPEKLRSFASGVGETLKGAAKGALLPEGMSGGRIPIDPNTGMPQADVTGGLRKAFHDDPYKAAGEIAPYALSGRPRSVGLPGAMGAAEGAAAGTGTAEALASKLPKVHPVAKFLAKRIPGVGTALDVLEALKEKYGTNLEGVPKMTRDELANRLYEEAHGKPPKTAQERVDAIKEFKSTLKTEKSADAPKAPEPFKPNPQIAKKMQYGGERRPDFTAPSPRVGGKGRGPAREGMTPGGKGTGSASAAPRVESTPPKPAGMPAPGTPGGTVSQREIGFNKVAADAWNKSVAIGKKLKEVGFTPEEAANPEMLTDEQLNELSKSLGYTAFRGKGLSRTAAEGRADIVRAMRGVGKGPYGK